MIIRAYTQHHGRIVHDPVNRGRYNSLVVFENETSFLIVFVLLSLVVGHNFIRAKQERNVYFETYKKYCRSAFLLGKEKINKYTSLLTSVDNHCVSCRR